MSEQELKLPSLFRRLAAIFYDSWLILAMLMLSATLLIIIRILFEGLEVVQTGRALPGYWRIPMFLMMVFVIVHFYVYFWLKNGQTLGMQTWRLRLDNNQHQRINLKQAYMRILSAILSTACLGLGFLWIFTNKEKLTWHDKLSNTHLVLLPKQAIK